jgi:hypothetical protein
MSAPTRLRHGPEPAREVAANVVLLMGLSAMVLASAVDVAVPDPGGSRLRLGPDAA